MVGLVLNLILTLGLLRASTSKDVKVRRGICHKCEYELTGLGLRGVCPECGTPFEPRQFRTVNLFLRRRSPEVLWATVPAAMIFAMLCATGFIEVLPYRLAGYSWSIAYRAAESRAGDGSESDWFLLSVFLGFAPLLGILPGRVRPILIFLVGLIAVATASDLIWWRHESW